MLLAISCLVRAVRIPRKTFMSPIHHAGMLMSSNATVLVLALVSLLYVRGWRRVRKAPAEVLSVWRMASFLLGISLVWAALGSPIVAYEHDLLTVHMIQHLLLMTFAPALILLGEPFLSFWHGLPRFGRDLLGPLFR